LAVLIIVVAGAASAKVGIGSGVVIHQPGNNATVNVTESFNASSLSVRSTTTGFGGSNFTVNGSTADTIDVKLKYYNASAEVGKFPANFTANTTSANNVTFRFSNFTASSLYESYQGFNLLKRAESTASGVYDFFYDSFSSAYKSFYVTNIDNRVPALNESQVTDNRKLNELNMTLTVDDQGEKDIESYTGSGTLLKFSNSTLRFDKLLPITDTYSVTDFKDATSTGVLVNVSTDESVLRQDGSGWNLSDQQVNKSITVHNTGDLELSYDLEFKNYGTEVRGESWLATVSKGGSLSHTGEWSGDWLKEREYGFEVAQDSVTLDSNYTGVRPLEIAESRGVAWTDIDTTGFVTKPSKCYRSNNSKIDVPSSTTTNYSVGFACNPGTAGNPSQTVNNLSTGERVWFNTTDAEVYTNKTENTVFRWKADKDNLKKPSDRDGGSLEGYADGNQVNVSVVDTGGYLVLKIGTQHTDSSWHTGTHSASITYTLDASDGSSGGSGGGSSGGGGGGSSDQPVVADLPPQSYGVAPGSTRERSFTIENLENRPNTVTVSVPAGEQCGYFQVQSNSSTQSFGKTGQYRVGAANSLTSGRARPSIQISMPSEAELADIGNSTIRCEIQASSELGRVEPLVASASPRTGSTLFADVQRFIEEGLPTGFWNDASAALYWLFSGFRGLAVLAAIWLSLLGLAWHLGSKL